MGTPQQPTERRPKVLTRAGWILLTLLFLGAIALDAFFSEKGVFQVWQLEKDYVELYREVEKLESENAELEKQINKLKTELSAVERVAREELGMAKPGEDVFVFLDESDDDKDSTQKPEPTQE